MIWMIVISVLVIAFQVANLVAKKKRKAKEEMEAYADGVVGEILRLCVVKKSASFGRAPAPFIHILRGDTPGQREMWAVVSMTGCHIFVSVECASKMPIGHRVEGSAICQAMNRLAAFQGQIPRGQASTTGTGPLVCVDPLTVTPQQILSAAPLSERGYFSALTSLIYPVI